MGAESPPRPASAAAAAADAEPALGLLLLTVRVTALSERTLVQASITKQAAICRERKKNELISTNIIEEYCEALCLCS